MAAVIQLAVDTVQDRHPAAKKFIIQSDNASGFSSQELIPFIFNMNTRIDDEKTLCLADGYSQKHRQEKHYLYTHYYFLNKNSNVCGGLK